MAESIIRKKLILSIEVAFGRLALSNLEQLKNDAYPTLLALERMASVKFRQLEKASPPNF